MTTASEATLGSDRSTHTWHVRCLLYLHPTSLRTRTVAPTAAPAHTGGWRRACPCPQSGAALGEATRGAAGTGAAGGA